MYDSRTLHTREVVARVDEAFGDTLLHTVIGRTVKFPDASVAAEPITTYAPTHSGADGLPPAGPRARRPWRRCLTARGARPAPTPSARRAPASAPAPSPGRHASAFEVHLGQLQGPFDLLLGLIAKHKLDVTEVALAAGHRRVRRVHPRRRAGVGPRRRPASSSSSPRPCSTSRPRGCCPAAEVEDDEDLALLEARDLLFARLLQYRAYKEVAADLAERLATEGRRVPARGAARAAPRRAAAGAGLADRAGAARRARGAGARAPRPPPGSTSTTCTRPRSACASRRRVIVDRLRRERVDDLPRR